MTHLLVFACIATLIWSVYGWFVFCWKVSDGDGWGCALFMTGMAALVVLSFKLLSGVML